MTRDQAIEKLTRLTWDERNLHVLVDSLICLDILRVEEPKARRAAADYLTGAHVYVEVDQARKANQGIARLSREGAVDVVESLIRHGFDFVVKVDK